MISLRKFIGAIQDAIVGANHTLMEHNVGLLDRYFEPESEDRPDKLKARTVSLEYVSTDNNGQPVRTEVQVPLITMVPLSMTRVEKARLSVSFEMTLKDDEVQMKFGSPKTVKRGFFGRKKDNEDVELSVGHLELTLAPHDPAEGFMEVVEGYENVLKAQIPH